MNNVSRMKVLSLAVLGLTGLALAGSAAAGTCPASPVPPWTSMTALGGGTLNITAGGLDTSSCKLDAALGNSAASFAVVRDDSPSSETRYRFQFLVDPSGTGSFSATDGVQVFVANAAAPFPTGGSPRVLSAALTPGPSGVKRITFTASCNDAGSNYRCIAQTADLPAGVNRIEGDLTIGAGAAGQLRYWINAPAGTTEPAPDGTIDNLDNSGWVGVDNANLGLSSPTPSYKTTHAGQTVSFDTFDSRRQTYIGH